MIALQDIDFLFAIIEWEENVISFTQTLVRNGTIKNNAGSLP